MGVIGYTSCSRDSLRKRYKEIKIHEHDMESMLYSTDTSAVYQPVCYGPRLTKTPLYGYYHYQGSQYGQDNPAIYNRKVRPGRRAGRQSVSEERGAVNSYKKLDKIYQGISETIFHQPPKSRKME